MKRITQVFEKAKKENRIALIGYLPAGYPDASSFLKLAECAFEAGLDFLEIGLPSFNPYFDGVIIRRAIEQSIQRGTNVATALKQTQQLLHSLQRTATLIFYPDVLNQISYSALLAQCVDAQVAGILAVGAPLPEWLKMANAAKQRDIAPIGFLSASMEGWALKQVLTAAEGFLYLQSRDAPTGSPGEFGDQIARRIETIRKSGPKILPVAVGFGVRRSQDVEQVRRMGADGVIVGTAFVEAAEQGCAALQDLVYSLSQAAVFS
jgi:tryptophan synthase alpha chain